jgi:hypothetical protein
MRAALIAGVALLPITAIAQEITQRPVRTEEIAGTPAGVRLYDFAAVGTVIIDWRAVEATAEGPADRSTTPIAKMMMAVRDGKWKPMSR